MAAASLVALLRERAQKQGDQLAYVFLHAGGERRLCHTYASLDRQARRIASAIQGRAAPGGRAVLVFEPGLDVLSSFFGCLYAGVVAAPVYPPYPGRLAEGLAAVERVVQDSRASLLLTSRLVHGVRDQLPRGLEGLARVPWLEADDTSLGDPDAWRDPGAGPSTAAFLQYTSGSTSTPKGVYLTHGNLLANQRAIDAAFQLPQDNVFVSWLPLYHDMGLVGIVMQSLFLGSPCYLMSPSDFLRKPVLWLRAISQYRGVCSGGPNFGYELCVRRIDEEECAGLDLSSWKLAFNGAEPIRAATVRRFAERFAPHGYDPAAHYPCYGMAESSLLVTGGVRGRGARILRLDRSALARGAATVVDGTVGDAGAAEVVSVGRAQPEHEVAVVDPERGRRLAEGEVGEIWVRGPSVASGGYWRMPEASEQAFSARIERGEERFLRTGDLGFLSGGELFVTGRLKDLLIVRGRKLHPHDVEDAAQLVDSRLRAGCGAAVAVETPEGEGIALIQECSTRDAAELKDLVGEIRRGVIQRLNVGLSGVVLTAPRSVPKTSSGKLRRRHCLEAYRVGALTVLHEEWMNTPPARHERVAGR